MRRSLGFAFLVVVVLAATPLATASATAKASVQHESALEQGILREVNRVRLTHGLRSLTVSRGLQASATFQSRVLLQQGVFDHESALGGPFSDRLRRFYPVGSAQSWSVGENLLWSTYGLDAPTAVEEWLNSPAHRRIMLDPTWREFGISAMSAPSAPGVYSAAGAVVVVTLDFGVRTTASRVTSAAAH